MEKEVLREPMFVEEIVNVIRSGLSEKELIERLRDYHVMRRIFWEDLTKV